MRRYALEQLITKISHLIELQLKDNGDGKVRNLGANGERKTPSGAAPHTAPDLAKRV